MVENLLKVEDLPPELRAKILERAEGNPFYVEELIRSLMDTEAIARDEVSGRWYATRAVAAIDLPDTLQGVLMARIDRLQQETKRILQMAAVIGRSFLYRVLAEITRAEQALNEHLDMLVHEQMIREQSRLPELEYIFKHALTQQAAYDSLLKKERRKFHLQVAQALERMFPDRLDELVGLLAYHWEQAGETRQAIIYLERAGEVARCQFAAPEAVDYFSRALALISEEDLRARYRVLQARELCYESMGESASQLEDVQAQQALVERLGDAECRVQAAQRLANYYWCVGDYNQAIVQAQETVRLAEAAGSILQQVLSYVTWSRTLMHLYEYAPALEIMQNALPLARQAKDQFLEGECLRNIGNLKLYLHEVEDGLAYIDQALALHRAMGNRISEAAALNTLGVTTSYSGELAQALAYFEQALQIYRETGNLYGQGMVLENLADFYNRRYDLENAISYTELALAIWRKARNRSQEAEVTKNLAWIRFHQENYQEARAGFDRSLAIMQEQGLPYSLPDWLENVGQAELAQGQLEAARAHFEEALAIVTASDVPDWRVNIVVVLGQALVRLGDLEAGEAHLTNVLQESRRLGERAAEMNALIWLGWLARSRKQEETAQAYCQQAITLAQQVGNRRVEAQANLFLGYALEGLGRLDEAAAAYQEALDIYLEQHLVKASQEVRAALARLALARGDLAQARQHVEIIQQHLQTSDLEGTINPDEVRRVCQQVLAHE